MISRFVNVDSICWMLAFLMIVRYCDSVDSLNNYYLLAVLHGLFKNVWGVCVGSSKSGACLEDSTPVLQHFWAVLLPLIGKLNKAIFCVWCWFFQKLEIQKGAKDFNLPVIRSNRKLVGNVNGGLHNLSPLVFNSAWKSQDAKQITGKFNYPVSSGIQRPKNDEDIAFMSVSASF